MWMSVVFVMEAVTRSVQTRQAPTSVAVFQALCYPTVARNVKVNKNINSWCNRLQCVPLVRLPLSMIYNRPKTFKHQTCMVLL